MHSQRLILNWNETFCKGAKWTHIAQSKGPVAGHYMIMNSDSTNCVHCARSEDVTAMIQFPWDVIWCCWPDIPSILELLYPEDKVIMFVLNVWNYSPSDSVTFNRTSIWQWISWIELVKNKTTMLRHRTNFCITILCSKFSCITIVWCSEHTLAYEQNHTPCLMGQCHKLSWHDHFLCFIAH